MKAIQVVEAISSMLAFGSIRSKTSPLTAGCEELGGWWVASTAPGISAGAGTGDGGGGIAARFNGAVEADLEWLPGKGLP